MSSDILDIIIGICVFALSHDYLLIIVSKIQKCFSDKLYSDLDHLKVVHFNGGYNEKRCGLR